jgi:NADP-reducing hydrogenase subunit HndB
LELKAPEGDNMKSLEELKAIRDKALTQVSVRSDENKIRIIVGMATCGIAAGAKPVMNALLSESAKRGLQNVSITQTGCVGMCRLEPLFEVSEPNGKKYTYINMSEEKAVRVINEHIVNGNPVSEYLIGTSEKN